MEIVLTRMKARIASMETKGKVIRLKHRVASSVIELQAFNNQGSYRTKQVLPRPILGIDGPHPLHQRTKQVLTRLRGGSLRMQPGRLRMQSSKQACYQQLQG